MDLPFPINTPRSVSLYQLNTIPEVNISQAIPNCESETASLVLSSLLFLSTPLSVYFWILQSELSSHTDYNYEFQLEINPPLEIKFPSQIKTKSCPPGVKNKKRSSSKAELRESSTCQDFLKFEYETGQIFQVGMKNGRASRANKGRRVRRISKADRGKS